MTNISALDALIKRLNETPLLTKTEEDRKYKAFFGGVFNHMVANNTTYGEAAGGLEHLNQTETDFRATIKDTNNDLLWQISVFNKSLDSWFQHGESHAPYYPWRIAVILSKQKMKTKEAEFLAAYCRHFRGRLGSRDAKIDARATKLGV